MFTVDVKQQCNAILQHVFISDNSGVRKNYFDSNIIQNENVSILRRVLKNYFEADIDRSDVIKARNLHA